MYLYKTHIHMYMYIYIYVQEIANKSSTTMLHISGIQIANSNEDVLVLHVFGSRSLESLKLSIRLQSTSRRVVLAVVHKQHRTLKTKKSLTSREQPSDAKYSLRRIDDAETASITSSNTHK